MRDRTESDRRYHQRHKAERNAASRAWDLAHPDRARERKRAYRQRQRAARRAAIKDPFQRAEQTARDMVTEMRQDIREVTRGWPPEDKKPLTRAEKNALKRGNEGKA